jgi:hypothetical protein
MPHGMTDGTERNASCMKGAFALRVKRAFFMCAERLLRCGIIASLEGDEQCLPHCNGLATRRKSQQITRRRKTFGEPYAPIAVIP